MSGLTFITNLKIQFAKDTYVLFPSYVLNNVGKFIKVSPGKPILGSIMSKDMLSEGFIGIYVNRDDFETIGGMENFIFAHDSDLVEDEERLKAMMVDIDKMPKQDDQTTMNFWLINEGDFIDANQE
jgi:hypothetical protein